MEPDTLEEMVRQRLRARGASAGPDAAGRSRLAVLVGRSDAADRAVAAEHRALVLTVPGSTDTSDVPTDLVRRAW